MFRLFEHFPLYLLLSKARECFTPDYLLFLRSHFPYPNPSLCSQCNPHHTLTPKPPPLIITYLFLARDTCPPTEWPKDTWEIAQGLWLTEAVRWQFSLGGGGEIPYPYPYQPPLSPRSYGTFLTHFGPLGGGKGVALIITVITKTDPTKLTPLLITPTSTLREWWG